MSWFEILQQIFDRQRSLMIKYKAIEQLPDPPLSLHAQHGQRILKDFAWRSTEELCESFECWENSANLEICKQEALEELADALHFLVELLIFAGITPAQCVIRVPQFPDDEDLILGQRFDAYWQATLKLGLAMNCLRNRPWKQSHVPTDEGLFRSKLLDAFAAHIDIWPLCEQSELDLLTYYLAKNDLNLARQEEGY
jgi:hypothetical protein